jgi:3-methyl-2-oxobutanoate hydroxymethyltransferase
MSASQTRPTSPVELASARAPAAWPRAQVLLTPLEEPVTVRTIQKWAVEGHRFACLTCYDTLTARWLERAGVPLLLVGDSAAEVILGQPSTIHAPLDFLIIINAAVKRGAPKCLVMADMPFMSYQTSEADCLHNAGRFMTEGLADAVKLEVDRTHLALIAKLAHAGVPAVAHLGLKPQHVKREGGYRAAGRTASQAKELISTAVAMEEAGATMILLEAMPAEVSAAIVEKVKIPVIGCGAGPACHGQIVVLQDLLGMTERQPAFATPMASLGRMIAETAAEWRDRVQSGDLGEHPYHMSPGEANALRANP